MADAMSMPTCPVFVPCAGTGAGDSSLLIVMRCQLDEGHEPPHVLELVTPQFEVVVTATEVDGADAGV